MSFTITRILKLESQGIDVNIEDFDVDIIKATVESSLFIEIQGWIIAKNPQVKSINIYCREMRSSPAYNQNYPLMYRRQNIVKKHELNGEVTPGFLAQFSLLHYPGAFTLCIEAIKVVEEHQTFIQLYEFDITNHDIRPSLGIHTKTLKPVAFISVGRSGSTIGMQHISRHPSVVTTNLKPFEHRYAVYELHKLLITSCIGHHQRSTHPDSLEGKFNFIGSNPFNHVSYTKRYEDPQPILEELHRDAPLRAAANTVLNIDNIYNAIKRVQNNQEAECFIEKILPGHVPFLLKRLFPETKMIILIRDFRDMIVSADAFNAKRDTQSFGQSKDISVENWVKGVAHGALIMEELVTALGEECLLIKYEDLISDQKNVLQSISTYLGIDCSDETITNILGESALMSRKNIDHQTSASPKASIGRWQSDASDEMKLAFEAHLHQALAYFDYLN